MPEDLQDYVIDFQPSQYFKNIHDFYFLNKVKYPFGKDELEDYEWQDLAYFSFRMEAGK